jgi:hypothetical protein
MLAARHKPCCSEINAVGQRLASQLEAMDVESLWLAHQHVDWETGEADRGGEYEGPGQHNLCSATAGQRAGSEAQERGWQEIAGAQRAQEMANSGNLVLVVCANQDPHEPGHVAIVRHSEKSAEALQRNGHQVLQSGTHNHNSTTVRIGASNHPDAWPLGVRYFVHQL